VAVGRGVSLRAVVGLLKALTVVATGAKMAVMVKSGVGNRNGVG
jgi:hypothetical protein